MTAIFAAVVVPAALAGLVPDMRVIDLSRDAMWVATGNPTVRDGVSYLWTMTLLGEAISGGNGKAPAIVRSVEMVKCATNEWKSAEMLFYTADGNGIEQRQGADAWTRLSPGIRAMRIADAACGRAAGATLPEMPLATLVSTYKAYRAAK